MKVWIRYFLIAFMTILVIIYLIYGSYNYYDTNFSKEDYENYNGDNGLDKINGLAIQDNSLLYKVDKKPEVEEIYITVVEKQKENTLNGIILKNNINGETEKSVEVLFESKDNKSIINNGLYNKEPNATLRIKGKESQDAPIKSFKITLNEKAGVWNGQSIINLNKNYEDSLRIRSKLSLDYIARVPNITSFQTSFVRLFIRNLSDGDDNAKFEDYGFFTHIEQPNKMALKSHGLDKNGQLYMAKEFKFERYKDKINSKDEKTYSKDSFEEVLEIIGSEDHGKLIEMLEAVNNYNYDIDQVIDKYFQRDNYLTWLAINIILNNYQANKENFLIYSPINSKTWYFMPWDFDEAIENNKESVGHKRGVTMLWDNVLNKRFLSKKNNVQDLTKKVEELSKIINKDTTRSMLDKYYPILMANITKEPDIKFLSAEFQDIIDEYNMVPNIIESNKIAYYDSIEAPMPFNIESIEINNASIKAQWEKSCSLQGRDISYIIEVSRDKYFKDVIFKEDNITNTSYTINGLKNGEYYLRITAKDSMTYTEESCSIYEDLAGEKFYGIDKVVIK